MIDLNIKGYVYERQNLLPFSAGGQLDELLKPRLHIEEYNILSPLAWYDSPKISNNNRLCFAKIGIQVISISRKIKLSKIENHRLCNYRVNIYLTIIRHFS